MSRSERSQRRTAFILGLVVAGMFGFGFAMVPLYGLICQAAGIQTATPAVAATDTPVGEGSTRTVVVKFDATVHRDLPWGFAPKVKSMEVPVGKMQRVDFEAVNLSDRAITGQAIPSVVPWQATAWFSKAECFCFRRQELLAGQRRDMPLAFWVSPDLPEGIDSLTLSYTFMRADAPQGPARQSQGTQNAH